MSYTIDELSKDSVQHEEDPLPDPPPTKLYPTGGIVLPEFVMQFFDWLFFGGK